MPVGVKVKVTGDKRYRKALQRIKPKKNTKVFSLSLRAVGLEIWKLASQKKIRRGRGRDAEPLDDELTYRDGGAAASIRMNLSGLPGYMEVGSDLEYPAIHEEGRGNYPERKWLEPAVDDIIPSRAESITVKLWEGQLRTV